MEQAASPSWDFDEIDLGDGSYMSVPKVAVYLALKAENARLLEQVATATSAAEGWQATAIASEVRENQYKAENANLRAEVEWQARLLVDGTKGMAILNGEILASRQENRALQSELEAASKERDEARKERDHWKANHEQAVRTKRATHERARTSDATDTQGTWRKEPEYTQSLDPKYHRYRLVTDVRYYGDHGDLVVLRSLPLALADRILADHDERAEVERGKVQCEGMEQFQDLVVAQVHSYSWLAEGRGPYRYDDNRYDDDVAAFTQSLLEALPTGVWEPSNSAFNRLTSQVQALKSQLEAALRERDEARALWERAVDRANRYAEREVASDALLRRCLAACQAGAPSGHLLSEVRTHLEAPHS